MQSNDAHSNSQHRAAKCRQYLLAWPIAGCSETLLDRICRNVKNGARRLIEILNQRGEP
ncbi:protease FtsH-inhibitory lysogeny factor CIII [Yersinia enterocolitica]